MPEYKNVEEKVIFEKLTDAPLYNQSSVQAGWEQSKRCDADGDDRVEGYIKELGNRIRTLEGQKDVSYYRIVASDRKLIGEPIVFAKRVIRRLIKWLIEPICVQQTMFNSEVTACISRMIEIEVDSRDNMNALRDKIKELEDSSAELERQTAAELKKQAKKVEELEKNNLFLKGQMSCLESSENENFWKKESNAQSGEDMIVAYISYAINLDPQECSYLDLGANHAKDMSNTYYFYKKGASGVLVEANPYLIKELKLYRSHDVVLNKCITSVSGEQIEFYILNGDGLSTPDYNGALEMVKNNSNLSIIDTVMVETITVNDILEQYFSKAPVILNVDIEGKEMEVLNSLNFEKYRPFIIIIEMIPYKPTLVVNEKREDVAVFMKEHHYIEYAFTGINSIYIDREKLGE